MLPKEDGEVRGKEEEEEEEKKKEGEENAEDSNNANINSFERIKEFRFFVIFLFVHLLSFSSSLPLTTDKVARNFEQN